MSSTANGSGEATTNPQTPADLQATLQLVSNIMLEITRQMTASNHKQDLLANSMQSLETNTKDSLIAIKEHQKNMADQIAQEMIGLKANVGTLEIAVKQHSDMLTTAEATLESQIKHVEDRITAGDQATQAYLNAVNAKIDEVNKVAE